MKTITKDKSQTLEVTMGENNVIICQTWQFKNHKDISSIDEKELQAIVNYARKNGMLID
jgi:hypothetical protein